MVFYRSRTGREPVREWLKELSRVERHAIGADLLRAQWRWPVGMLLFERWAVGCQRFAPTCLRVLICVHENHLVALHGFIKKTRTAPEVDLKLARQRQVELKR